MPASSAITTRAPSARGSSRARASATSSGSARPSAAPGIPSRSGRRALKPPASQPEPVASTTTSGRSAAISAGPAAFARRSRPSPRSSEATRSSTARCQLPRVGSHASPRRCPPGSPARSCTTTRCPRAAAVAATRSPAGPAPTTTIERGSAAGTSVPSPHSASRPVAGLRTHATSTPARARPTQTLAPTQRVDSRARPARLFRIRCGSARWARVIPTTSAAPSATARAAGSRPTTRPATKTAARSPTTRFARAPNGSAYPSGTLIGEIVR